MDLLALNESNAPPGTALRPRGVTYTEADVQAFLDRTGESPDDYRLDGRVRVPPAQLLAEPIRIIHENFHYETGVHVSSRMTMHRLPFAGDPLTIAGTVKEYFERGGNKYVTLDIRVLDAGGDELMAIDHVSIYQLRAKQAAG
jgi:hypothetical protein